MRCEKEISVQHERVVDNILESSARHIQTPETNEILSRTLKSAMPYHGGLSEPSNYIKT